MPIFVAFEGIDGCGKGTQIHLASKWLFNKDKRNTVVVTRNPYSYPEYEEEYQKIRGLLKTMANPQEQATALLDLFVANRRYHSANTVVPELKRGHHVLTDRYHVSTFAYQGGLQGIPFEHIAKIHEGIRMPDITLLFDVPAEVGLERRAQDQGLETKEVFDQMKVSETERLRQAYLSCVSRVPYGRIVVIDGTPSPEAVFSNVKIHLEELLKI